MQLKFVGAITNIIVMKISVQIKILFVFLQNICLVLLIFFFFK